MVLNDANFNDSKFKASVSLLACSSKYGFVVTGTVGGKTKKGRGNHFELTGVLW